MRIARVQSLHTAFTLIEIVVSGALMSIILAAAYACLSGGFSSRKLIDSRSDALQSARVALDLIARDLRAAVPLSKDYEFVGMHRELEGKTSDNVDFATRNYIPRRAREFDFCEVSYFVQPDDRTRTLTLYRRRDPTPDPEPLAGGAREEIVRGVKSFQLEYYDGYEWYDEWGDPTGKKQTRLIPEPNMTGLPEAVRITLTVDPAFEHPRKEDESSTEPPLTLQTMARLNMSLFFYRSSGTNNASTSNGTVSSPGGESGGLQ